MQQPINANLASAAVPDFTRIALKPHQAAEIAHISSTQPNLTPLRTAQGNSDGKRT